MARGCAGQSEIEMRILITGSDSPLGSALRVALQAQGHALILADTSTELRDLATAQAFTRGVNIVVHLAPLVTRLGTDENTLDLATRGTVHVLNAAAQAGAQRVILASSMALFESLPEHYAISEKWRPRPTSALPDLCAWLGEMSTREIVRSTHMDGVCLRFGSIVDDATFAGASFDPRWLHIDDAVSAIDSAIAMRASGWHIFNIVSADARSRFPLALAQEEPLHYQPKHSFTGHAKAHTAMAEPITQIAARPVRKVIILGAGGPLASAATRELEGSYVLRLTDVKPVEELLATVRPQSPGAPQPIPPQPPHEWCVVDVRDPQQVMAACESMDAIINCTVLRNNPHDAFLVNCLGAYNVMRAAVAHGIQRVVHTGPYQLGERGRTGYDWDDRIVDDVPPRPGLAWLYFISKLQGQEIVRIFAEQFGLVVPALTFNEFVNPEIKRFQYLESLSISWGDAARAIRCGLEVPSLPSPFEYFHVGTDLPHGVFSNDKAKRLLGWTPHDLLEAHYTR
jgi:nucleoside-diphosphate-sugar epimerase